MKHNPESIALITGIRYFARNCFSIPAPIVAAYFSHYKKVHWSGEYLQQQLSQGTVICRHGIFFTPILHESATLIDTDSQYVLSFRASSHNEVKPYVLVRKA